MNKYSMSKIDKKLEIKDKIIKRQMTEIESLREMVIDLKIDCDKKDKLTTSIDTIRNNLFAIIDDLKMKSEEYDELIAEVTEMKNVMNRVVFKNKWKLIRLLMK